MRRPKPESLMQPPEIDIPASGSLDMPALEGLLELPKSAKIEETFTAKSS